jgi:hypothetical protein
MKYLGYILTSDENEYVESYSLSAKEITVTDIKEDAIVFNSLVEADYFAEKLGCKVENL